MYVFPISCLILIWIWFYVLSINMFFRMPPKLRFIYANICEYSIIYMKFFSNVTIFSLKF